MKARWPTALAVGLAVLVMAGGGSGSKVTGFGETLLILPLLYLILARLEQPRASWPMLVILSAGIFALQAQDVIAPVAVLVPVALIVLVWGGVGGKLRRLDAFAVQALGMVAFGALALVGLSMDVDLGLYVVAAGWFLHGVWDVVHLRLDRVVSRTYAEWCGVFDVLIAAGLLLLG